jgi:carbon storage regulator CsrA
MLVLTRKIGEGAHVGMPEGPIEVIVLSVSGDRVRLGFKGDRSVPVKRGELLENSDGRRPDVFNENGRRGARR